MICYGLDCETEKKLLKFILDFAEVGKKISRFSVQPNIHEAERHGHQNCFDSSFSTIISPEIPGLVIWPWRWNRTDA